MSDFLHKLFCYRKAFQVSNEDTDLEKFYTNSEHARLAFEHLITATTTNLPKRLLVIYGLGGMGKSTLLEMYALTYHKHHPHLDQWRDTRTVQYTHGQYSFQGTVWAGSQFVVVADSGTTQNTLTSP